jgi:hypothetical protein
MQQLQIRRLFFVETGSYEDQMLRPYETNLNTRTLNQLQEATQGGRNLTSSNVAGIAGQIIRPSAMAQGIAPIAQGWGDRRLRFLLEVVEPDGFGGESVQYLTGFTSHVGVSMQSQQLDPNMELFFNTSIQTRRVPYMSPTGNIMQQRVNDASHILTGVYNPSYGHLQQATHSMRPQDVFAAVGASTLMQYGGDIVDTRTAFSQGRLKKSLRGNSAAPSYLSRLLTTHSAVMATSEESDNLDDMMGQAAGAVQEPLVSKDTLLHVLSMRSRLSQGGCVTYRELCQLQPDLDRIAEVFVARSIQAQAQNHQRGQSEHWQGSTHETMMATILAHAVPAVMMDLMITKVGFKATNRTLNGQTEVLFTGVMTFAEGIDMTPFLQNFEHRLRAEVLSDISHGGIVDYDLEAKFDIVGDTVISISVGGQPHITYTTPSFADSLFVPVLTNDQFGLQKLATDVTTLAENLQVDHSARNTYSPSVLLENTHGTTFAL